MARLKWDNSYSGRGYQIDNPNKEDVDDEYIDPKKIKVKKGKSPYPFPSANTFLNGNQNVIAVFKTKIAMLRRIKGKSFSEVKFQGHWEVKDIDQILNPVYITFEEDRVVEKCSAKIQKFEKTSDGLISTFHFKKFKAGYFRYNFFDDYKDAFKGKSKDCQLQLTIYVHKS